MIKSLLFVLFIQSTCYGGVEFKLNGVVDQAMVSSIKTVEEAVMYGKLISGNKNSIEEIRAFLDATTDRLEELQIKNDFSAKDKSEMIRLLHEIKIYNAVLLGARNLGGSIRSSMTPLRR